MLFSSIIGKASISARSAMVFFVGFFPFISATMPVLTKPVLKLIFSFSSCEAINSDVLNSLKDNSGFW